jgi:small nuclear ribonucleoprotein (snRNP)-like protein
VWVPFPFPRSSEREIAMIITLREKKKNKQEYVNGQLKNKYGDAFVRGNNVLYISAVKDK